MHNADLSSTIYALRSKGSLSFSSNDYNSYYLLNDRFDRNHNHSSFAQCCSCCGVSSHSRVPINKSYLYGPRQSSLLQWSAYRKLIYGGGGDRYCNHYYYNYYCFSGSPIDSLERGCCDVSRSVVDERTVYCNDNSRRRGKAKLRCYVVDDTDTESLLSLFGSEVDSDNCFVSGGKRTNRGSCKRVVGVKDSGFSSEKVSRAEKRLGVGDGDGVCECGKGKNGELKLSEVGRSRGFERIVSKRSEKESGGAISRGENRRVEKEDPGFSSHCSVTSSGGFEDEREVHDKHALSVDDENEKVSRRRSGAEWDRSSGSEKKRSGDRLVGEEVRQSGSERTRVSGLRRERLSDSDERFNGTEEISEVNLDRRTRKHYARIENRVGEASTSRRNSAENEELRETNVRDDPKTTSQSRIRLDIAEENVETSKDERQKAVSHQTEEEESTSRDARRRLRISEVEDYDTRRTSVSQNRAEIGVTEESSRQAEARRSSQQAIRVSEIDLTNIENTSITQSQTNISNQVNNTNVISVSYQGYTEPHHPQTGQRPPQRIQSGTGSFNVDETGVFRASETERIVGSRVASETRVRQETEAISVINNRTNETRASTSRARVRNDDEDEAARRSSRTTVTPPRSQSLSRSSVRAELESGFESQRVSRTTSESSSSSLRRDSPRRSERLETPGEALYHSGGPEDALGSADRLQRSSAQILGEFVEDARHGASSSEQKEDGGSGTKVGPPAEMWDVSDPSSVFRTPKTDEESGTKGGPPTEEESGTATAKKSARSLWNVIADIVTLKWGSRSETPVSRSGSRVPPDESAASETWLSTHESELNRGKSSNGSRSEAKSGPLQVTGLSTTAQGTDSDQFTDRTRYRPAPDRTGSGSMSEAKSGPLQVTGLSSPAQGTDSDRFSDRTRYRLEADRTGSGFTSEAESGPLQVTGLSSPAQGTDSDRFTDRTRYPEPGSGSMAKRISLPGDENLSSNEDGKISQSSSSGTEIAAAVSQVPVAAAAEVPMAEGVGGELKRRKLQRIKQVPKDRFDEWEEAFTVETEQRRLDEMFMREALLEAKKAADTWEVPVGAVLVHNGTIIARGYNLVEELRDSTAHAEMLCIREASNQLRSWRLSDTTLYVTLEPCPMCAGAILQARISTLVWGAPNKLLGADGSWIRLFPDGGEGGNRPEASEKAAPPVHPFHPKMNIRRGVLESDCSEVMRQFFQLRRKKKEKQAAADQSHSPRFSTSHISKLHKKMHDVFHVMFCL